MLPNGFSLWLYVVFEYVRYWICDGREVYFPTGANPKTICSNMETVCYPIERLQGLQLEIARIAEASKLRARLMGSGG